MKKAVLLLLWVALSGCVPVVVVGSGALGAAWVGSDPRTSEVVRADSQTRMRLETQIADTYKARAHVNVHSYNGVLLLTGEVPDEAARQQIETLGQEYEPKLIINETAIRPTSTLADRVKDSQLATRARTRILSEVQEKATLHLLVVTEAGTVYLMGVASKEVADRVAQSASQEAGVKQVVKLMETDKANK